MADPGRRLSGGAHSNGHPEIANALLEGIERSDAPIVALDLSGCIQFLSQGFAEMAGVSKTDTVVGAPSKLLFPDGSVPRNANDRKTQLQSLSNGTSLSVNWQPNPAGGWIGTAEAQSSESAAADGTSAGEMVDPLTKVGTRLALNKAYEDLRLTRGPDDIAVLCIDLDHFKKVNDTFGHLVGDAVLKKAAERLRMATRPTDFVARFGGDEFVILIADDNIVDSATSVAERLIEMLSRSFLIEGHLINIGASVGASRAAEDGKDGVAEDLSEMFRRADVALYDAKEGGRGRHIWHEPVMDEKIHERRKMELELRKALPLNQFHLYYQPQFALGSDAICGFEALIRWIHPERGLVPPGDFIPLAEEIGLTAPIGTWVLNEACQQAAFWPSSISIAVNISPIQFLDSGFLPSVQAALEAAGLPPERLEIEVTENVLFGDEDEAAKVMHAIRDMGVRLAIDDFGTGYSSLHYLRKFPFTKIKIDQSFVRVSEDDAIAHEIVNAIAALGKAFGMETIAEGVETSDQLEQIRARGCQAVQGFLFSRPLPIAEANAYLQTKLGTSGRNSVEKQVCGERDNE